MKYCTCFVLFLAFTAMSFGQTDTLTVDSFTLKEYDQLIHTLSGKPVDALPMPCDSLVHYRVLFHCGGSYSEHRGRPGPKVYSRESVRKDNRTLTIPCADSMLSPDNSFNSIFSDFWPSHGTISITSYANSKYLVLEQVYILAVGNETDYGGAHAWYLERI